MAEVAGACYGGVGRRMKMARRLAQGRREASSYEAPIHREKGYCHVMRRVRDAVLMEWKCYGTGRDETNRDDGIGAKITTTL
jgi:hypothetical protein